jgi:RNAse (barnase) inhibitor barstar
MPIVPIPADRISDWDSFHDVFAEALGFPSFYGRNMDAWIDCLTSADTAAHRMVAADVAVSPGDVLTLQIDNVDDFVRRAPEQYEALVECSAFVNWRRIEAGERPIIALSFFKS